MYVFTWVLQNLEIFWKPGPHWFGRFPISPLLATCRVHTEPESFAQSFSTNHDRKVKPGSTSLEATHGLEDVGAGRPCCRPCKTPATFSIYWGLSRWWLSAPWGSWWWWWRTWRAGWCQDQAPEGNYTSRENYVKAKVPECGILASKTSDQVERHQAQEQQPGAVPHLQHLESFT